MQGDLPPVDSSLGSIIHHNPNHPCASGPVPHRSDDDSTDDDSTDHGPTSYIDAILAVSCNLGATPAVLASPPDPDSPDNIATEWRPAGQRW